MASGSDWVYVRVRERAVEGKVLRPPPSPSYLGFCSQYSIQIRYRKQKCSYFDTHTQILLALRFEHVKFSSLQLAQKRPKRPVCRRSPHTKAGISQPRACHTDSFLEVNPANKRTIVYTVRNLSDVNNPFERFVYKKQTAGSVAPAFVFHNGSFSSFLPPVHMLFYLLSRTLYAVCIRLSI